MMNPFLFWRGGSFHQLSKVQSFFWVKGFLGFVVCLFFFFLGGGVELFGDGDFWFVVFWFWFCGLWMFVVCFLWFVG